MDKIIISDTSWLIALEKINRLDILQKLFKSVTTTPEVQQEFGSLPGWILIQSVKNIDIISDLQKVVDKGEASAIALALESKNSLLIIDERKGRKLAVDLSIRIIGTLRILLLAKQRGIITEVQPIIYELSKLNFRFSKLIVEEILKIAGEA